MIPEKLKLFLLAACCTASGLASAQIPKDEGAWADTDKSGRPAPMTFPNFHRSQLLYSQVVETLTAAGCKQEDTETFIHFTCETNPKQWYLTKPGKPEHPALYVAAAESADGYTIGHSRMLLEVRAYRPEPPSIERREAFAVWIENMPDQFRKFVGGPIDWNVILANGPLPPAQMRDRATLTYEMVMTALEAAEDCTRKDTDAYIEFDCATSKTRWYLTRKGMPAHGALTVLFSTSHLGDDESDYMMGMQARFPRPRTPEETAAGDEAMNAWIRTLPGQSSHGMPVEPWPLNFSLTGSPFLEQDIRPTGRIDELLTHDAALQKLTDASCTRKDVGDYLAFTCQGSPLLFVLSAPNSVAHPAMMIAEADPSGQAMQALHTKPFLDGSKRQTEESWAVHTKWSRGISYLPTSELR